MNKNILIMSKAILKPLTKYDPHKYDNFFHCLLNIYFVNNKNKIIIFVY